MGRVQENQLGDPCSEYFGDPSGFKSVFIKQHFNKLKRCATLTHVYYRDYKCKKKCFCFTINLPFPKQKQIKYLVIKAIKVHTVN